MNLNQLLVPGDLVCHPERPDWGIGQVQSVTAEIITVNFEEAGKVSINSDIVEFRLVSETE